MREWSAVTYRRELDLELKKLHDKFHDWEEGKLDCFDLSDAIHQFHGGPQKMLYCKYALSRDDLFLVSIAVREGILSEQELPDYIVSEICLEKAWRVASSASSLQQNDSDRESS